MLTSTTTLNQSRRSVTELAGTALHVNHLLPLLLPMVTDVNNKKWTDFAATSLPEVIANKIFTYGTMWKLYTDEKSKYLLHACLMLSYDS